MRHLNLSQWARKATWGGWSPSPLQGRGAPASLTEQVAEDTQWTQDFHHQPGLTRTLLSPHTREVMRGATGRSPVSPSQRVMGGGELDYSDQGPIPWMSTKAGQETWTSTLTW